MSERVTTDLDPDGRAVACKRSRSTADSVRLANEADVLGRARHPGVVELLSVTRDEDGMVELVTAFAGTHSLDTCGPLSLSHAAGLMASLATTVADLHDLGVVHGRIEPSHVVLGTSGQPVLCGFAGGGQASTIPPASPQPPPDFCDPAAPIGAPLEPSADVFGLGALLRTLVLDSGTDVEPIPDRWWSLGRLRKPWSGYQRRALLNLSDQATDDEPLRRPPARRLAAAIRDTMPTARLAPVVAPQAVAPGARVHVHDADDPFASLRPSLEPDVARAGPGRLLTLMAGGVGLSLFFFGLSSLRGGEAPVAPTVESVSAPVSAAPPVTDAEPDATPVTSRHGEADRVVTLGTARYEVGSPGDVVTVGDWDCDGEATPAVLRPATGEVFVFDAWAGPGADVEVGPVLTVPGGIDLSDEADDQGCPVLVVATADGRSVEVPT